MATSAAKDVRATASSTRRTSLFREHGIKGIGVDAIAEAAGTNKMTLYRHFGSKDELIAECMRDQARKAEEKWTEILAAQPRPASPAARLGAARRRRRSPRSTAAATSPTPRSRFPSPTIPPAR